MMTWLWVLPWALALAVAEVVVALIMRRYRCRQIINYLSHVGIIRPSRHVRLYTIYRYIETAIIVSAAYAIYLRLYGNTIFLVILIIILVLSATSLPYILYACVKDWRFICRQCRQYRQSSGLPWLLMNRSGKTACPDIIRCEVMCPPSHMIQAICGNTSKGL